jgi:hypothetical protein
MAATAAGASPLAMVPQGNCKNPSPDEVLVCAPSREHYRIDPSVLAASREHDSPPPKPPVTAEAVPQSGCIGGQGQGCGGGGIVPLVGMALVAARAAELAANGDDWRDAIRIHEDEYRLYQEAEARKAKDRKPKIGLVVGR